VLTSDGYDVPLMLRGGACSLHADVETSYPLMRRVWASPVFRVCRPATRVAKTAREG